MRTDPGDAGARAEVDRCAGCGGLFLEFFDGEPSAISRGLRERRDLSEGRARGAHDAPLSCPDCEAPMARRPYLGQGPELARCDTCLAVFLSPSDVEALARLELEPEARKDPSWLERLLRWLPR